MSVTVHTPATADSPLLRFGTATHVRLVAPGTASAQAPTLPLRLVSETTFDQDAAELPPASRRWMQTLRFRGVADTFALLPDADGRPSAVWAGVRDGDPYALAMLPRVLPPLALRIDTRGAPHLRGARRAAFGWALGGYRFERYRAPSRQLPTLDLDDDEEARAGLLDAEATVLVRDLVNTPAEHLGPAELGRAVQELADRHEGARVEQTVGDALLAARYPAIHAVGRAAAPERAPRLIELHWGRDDHPTLVLVGKGVCFDTGGLDIKPADGMRWMKKDMGGAAHAMALAHLVMSRRLPVRLTLLVPAVENAVGGAAMRPGDVFITRKQIAIEIGNTDAEGRVILCDALARACEGRPDLVIDLATLTGAARVALGPDLPGLFCRDTAMARELVDRSLQLRDPLWHLPLWDGYHPMIESDIADIVNTGKGPKGGAITAALFLADFVPAQQPWLHLDVYAWNDGSRPGRPTGGEMQGVRALADLVERRYRR